MASITSRVGDPAKCVVVIYNPARVADGSCPYSLPSGNLMISITQTHPSLSCIIGPYPNFVLLLSSLEASKNPFFHGSCAYLKHEDELYITSDLLQPRDSSQPPVILISRVRLGRDVTSNHIKEVEWSKLRPPPEIPMPAGAVALKDSVQYCSQGNLTHGSSSGVAHMTKGKPPLKLVNNYFGTHFGTVCALAVDPTADWEPGGHENHAIWFVDAGNRGYEAGFRPPARLPPMIWRYNTTQGNLRAMTDEIRSPWDITFSPDGRTIYVSDSGPGRAEKEAGGNSMGSIYAFDVTTRSGSPFLTGKRLFARALSGTPKGIICDSAGNVFAGCGDGVEIWNPGGTLLGVIRVPAPVSSLGWGIPGELFICADRTLWRVRLADPGEAMA